ncbi:MAG: hypothetical protein CMM93_05345 [Rickettsiales bacterium]|nr:hypothetical protein [Rickettsiales bacterium]|tara:strand:+ start:225 stop:983 length:759 start_codon:yes stop_codon:yes gene_type:complete
MRHAFSLVELSIVLVILGLLTGGILTGQSLIRAAELRSVSTDFQKYQTATMSFKDKYFALPGDMRNAESFWGAMTGCTGTNPNGTGTQTCNGDGDGMVESATAATEDELFQFWRQLANAGLVEGTYTGVSGSGSYRNSIIGQNVPASRVSNAGYTYRWKDLNTTSDVYYFPQDGKHIFEFAGPNTTDLLSSPVLSPEEAWNVDVKLDDGRPALGKLRAKKAQTACHTSTTAAVSEYRLTDTSIACSLSIEMQ